MVEAPDNVIRAAQRVHRNPDFRMVMEHLKAMQGNVVLNMDALSSNLAHAKIYYDALCDVEGLVETLAKEPNNG